MATARATFVDDSGDVRLSGYLTLEDGTFTVDGPLFVDSSDDDATVAFRVLAGSTSTVGIDLKVDPSDSVLRLEGLDNEGSILLTDDFSTNEVLVSNSAVQVSAGGVVEFFAGGQALVFAYHSAPSDGALSAGQCALWFDQTNGAGKLMVKAKTANGTVVTAAIALA